MTMTHPEAQKLMDTARSKSSGKPIQNNTRLYVRGEGPSMEFGVVLHGTEVVTILPNGRYTLRSGGYQTVTTMERIRRYSPAKLFSERGSWYIRLEPRKSDPAPDRYERTIPKPFKVKNPGPEPIKTDTGWVIGDVIMTTAKPCCAGRSEVHEALSNTHHFSYGNDAKPDGVIVKKWYGSEPFADEFSAAGHVASYRGSTGYGENVVKLVKVGVFFGESSRGYSDEWWRLATGRGWNTGEYHAINGIQYKYRQCDHCRMFNQLHDFWSAGYNGYGWGRNRKLGYKLMAEMLDRFGAVEAWQEAYIADYRARREYTRLAREWDERNRVAFFDGIEVNCDGYALRLRSNGPSPAKLRRHEKAVERMKKRIDKYVKGYVEALETGMAVPSSGDCWYCLMFDKGVEDAGQKPSSDHLDQHMRERYYVPSLIVNALRARGYKDIGIVIHLGFDDACTRMGGERISKDIITRDLRTYLRKRLIPAAPTN
jgi:hypothetical protein